MAGRPPTLAIARPVKFQLPVNQDRTAYIFSSPSVRTTVAADYGKTAFRTLTWVGSEGIVVWTVAQFRGTEKFPADG